MSILSEKYEVPEQVIKNMIKDGLISCSWNTYDEVRKLYKEGKSTAEIGHLTHMSQRRVQQLIKEFFTK